AANCSSLGATYSITLSFEATNIVFGFDRPKNKGRWTLPADGVSKATPYLNDPNTPTLQWSITGAAIGAAIDASSGVVTAGTQTGTINVHSQTSSEIGRAHV